MHFDPHLIFDIGMHKGHDSYYYLRKGFRVVGVEARSDLCDSCRDLLKDYIASGSLTIVQRAVYFIDDASVSFYVNKNKDDWGSLTQGAADKGTGDTVQITVKTVALHSLFAQYGIPYYLKCDIEGGDAMVARHLIDLPQVPPLVSIELTNIDDLHSLRLAGYKRFQLVNQQLNPWTKAPEVSLEGSAVDVTFTHEMSGLFGKDLNRNGWLDFDECARRLKLFFELKRIDPSLAIGWVDVHATTGLD